MRPFLMGKIRADVDTAAAPRFFRESTDLQNKSTLLLAEPLQLLPILNPQARYHGVMRNRRRVKEPGLGDQFPEF